MYWLSALDAMALAGRVSHILDTSDRSEIPSRAKG